MRSSRGVLLQISRVVSCLSGIHQGEKLLLRDGRIGRAAARGFDESELVWKVLIERTDADANGLSHVVCRQRLSAVFQPGSLPLFVSLVRQPRF
jgi:hypothetical protein